MIKNAINTPLSYFLSLVGATSGIVLVPSSSLSHPHSGFPPLDPVSPQCSHLYHWPLLPSLISNISFNHFQSSCFLMIMFFLPWPLLEGDCEAGFQETLSTLYSPRVEVPGILQPCSPTSLIHHHCKAVVSVGPFRENLSLEKRRQLSTASISDIYCRPHHTLQVQRRKRCRDHKHVITYIVVEFYDVLICRGCELGTPSQVHKGSGGGMQGTRMN